MWSWAEAETVCSGNGVQLVVVAGEIVSKQSSGEPRALTGPAVLISVSYMENLFC